MTRSITEEFRTVLDSLTDLHLLTGASYLFYKSTKIIIGIIKKLECLSGIKIRIIKFHSDKGPDLLNRAN